MLWHYWAVKRNKFWLAGHTVFLRTTSTEMISGYGSRTQCLSTTAALCITPSFVRLAVISQKFDEDHLRVWALFIATAKRKRPASFQTETSMLRRLDFLRCAGCCGHGSIGGRSRPGYFFLPPVSQWLAAPTAGRGLCFDDWLRGTYDSPSWCPVVCGPSKNRCVKHC